VLFALATLGWALGLAVERRLPRLRAVHAGLALYVGWAAISLAMAFPRHPSGPGKLLGLAMLAALLVVTSDLAGRPGMPAAIGKTIAVTSLVTAVAALAGVVLSGFGVITPLVGTCGDLLPGPLSRAQAGFPHPNLLANFCVFAYGVVAREDSGLSPRWRRLGTVALALTVVLTTSRAILAFGLATAIRHATTPARRRFAWSLAAVLVAAMIGLTLVNVTFQPLRPWDLHLRPGPSVRLEAATSSLATLAAHPLFGSGLGSSPGRRGSLAFDAHLTPLNVAASLGLPALAGLAFVVATLWRERARPTDLALWGLLAGIGLDGIGQDVEDFRHVWVALGLADAARRDAEATA
jgi:O-Antigen ligase